MNITIHIEHKSEEQQKAWEPKSNIGEKPSKIGATPEYNFKICDKYCKYYDYWTYGQIKQWELEEICDKCEIFAKNR